MENQEFSGFERSVPNLFWWEVFDRRLKAPLSSCALKTVQGLVLFDPVPLPPSEQRALTRAAAPCAILLTNDRHERAAESFRLRYHVPVVAPAAGRYETLRPDRLFHPGERLPGGIVSLAVPGACPCETAYWDGGDGGVLVQGDSLINIGGQGLAFLPDRYADDPGRLKASVGAMLRTPFSMLTTAHGRPLTAARPEIHRLLKGIPAS